MLIVARAVREHLKDATQTNDRDLINTHVVRVEVQTDQSALELKAAKQGSSHGGANGTPPSHEPDEPEANHTVLLVPWQKPPSKRRREIMVPNSAVPRDARPIRAETRAKLVASIARGRRWLDEIAAGIVLNVEQIAAREKCSVHQVNMTISLASVRTDVWPSAAG